MHPSIQFAPREQQLSATSLSTTAEAGFFAGRHCRVPSDWPSPLLRFMDGPARPAPRPSAASRPMPRSPRSAA